jgi:hypothetical protein
MDYSILHLTIHPGLSGILELMFSFLILKCFSLVIIMTATLRLTRAHNLLRIKAILIIKIQTMHTNRVKINIHMYSINRIANKKL